MLSDTCAIERVNLAFGIMTGYLPDELDGLAWQALLDPDEVERFEQQWLLLRLTGDLAESKWLLRRKDDAAIPVILTAQKLLLSDQAYLILLAEELGEEHPLDFAIL
ncbi:MAG: PAS domain-containing protein [Sphingobacteriia bacterium]